MNKQLTTITFLSCIREAINLSVESMEGLKESKSLQKFIMNEATDYEILHFVTTGTFPNEKYNLENEAFCMEAVKNELNSNYFEISEILGEEGADNLVESLEPLSEYGLTSNATVLEYLIDSGLMPALVEGGFTDAINKGKRYAKDKYKRYKGTKEWNKKVNKYAATDEYKQRLKKQKEKERLDQERKNKLVSPEERKAWYEKEKREEEENRRKNYPPTKVDKAKTYVKKAAGNLKQGYNAGKKYVDKKMNRVAVNVSKAERNLKKDYNSGKKYVKNMSNTGKALGGTILAGTLLYGAYKTYQRFFSKAARACSGKSGADKSACMQQFKVNATKAQISDLKRSASKCKNTSNPQKCQASINSKIQKLQSKL